MLGYELLLPDDLIDKNLHIRLWSQSKQIHRFLMQLEGGTNPERMSDSRSLTTSRTYLLSDLILEDDPWRIVAQ